MPDQGPNAEDAADVLARAFQRADYFGLLTVDAAPLATWVDRGSAWDDWGCPVVPGRFKAPKGATATERKLVQAVRALVRARGLADHDGHHAARATALASEAIRLAEREADARGAA